MTSLIPWSSRYLPPALNTMVNPSGTVAIQAFNAALASEAPVESIDEGTARPFGFGLGVGVEFDVDGGGVNDGFVAVNRPTSA